MVAVVQLYVYVSIHLVPHHNCNSNSNLRLILTLASMLVLSSSQYPFSTPKNTYLYERQCEDRGHADKFPPYIENFEVWFGNILPPMENERRRFGFYDVRKRTKKADKQMLLWTGVVFTREEDVQKVKELIIDEVGRIKPLFEDVEDTGAKTFALSNIVGKAKQRRWADAFVRADVEREGSLPADKVFEIIQGPKYKHQLEIKVILPQTSLFGPHYLLPLTLTLVSRPPPVAPHFSLFTSTSTSNLASGSHCDVGGAVG